MGDFFSVDCLKYSLDLLGKTYCFTLDKSPAKIVCAFTVANDSIKTTFLPGSRKTKVNRGIAEAKRMRSYPAVLIGRLGVHYEHQDKGLGWELMDFIKSWFVDGANKTGCRFIVVDAYNETKPLKYYERNDFEYLFSTEAQEKEYLKLKEEDQLTTRLMYFDLILINHAG